MDQEYIAQTALDQMVGTDQGQLLKALIPYFPPRQQQFLSVFAKARELSNTVALFTKPSEAMQIQAAAAPAQPHKRPAPLLFWRYTKDSGSDHQYDDHGRNAEDDE